MSKTRLTAVFALLAIGLIALVVAGCGSSDDDSTSASTSGGESTEASGGGEPLSVGSDIPYPPFEQGKAGEYTGFDIELMEAIGEKIGRTPEFTDTSFETIF
ncbi:MAG: transporter substrate-binding domain-containing protein, partial [Solirubrobacterales bacterium]